jgi:hypothetical protein
MSSIGATYVVYVALVDAYGAHAISDYDNALSLGRRKPGLGSLPDHVELLDHIAMIRAE